MVLQQARWEQFPSIEKCNFDFQLHVKLGLKTKSVVQLDPYIIVKCSTLKINTCFPVFSLFFRATCPSWVAC